MTEEEVGYVLLIHVTPTATVAATAYLPTLACLCSHLMVQGGGTSLSLCSPPRCCTCCACLCWLWRFVQPLNCVRHGGGTSLSQ